MALETLVEVVRKREKPRRIRDIGPLLCEAILAANSAVYREAETRGLLGMGTTLTALYVRGRTGVVGHVGDSRAYRIRNGELEQLTEDHSLVADLMRSGRLTPEEADAHPQRSVITRALGTDADVDVDTVTVDVEPGDLFLLCSDGLTTMVPEEDILRIAQEADNLDGAARTLVRAANSGGGEDNITVVLFKVEGDEARKSLEVLDEMLGHPDTSRSLFYIRLLRKSGLPGGAPRLITILNDPQRPLVARRRAIAALADLGEPEGLDALIALWEREPDGAGRQIRHVLSLAAKRQLESPEDARAWAKEKGR